jgi:Raf kinase inhibitor-like YbhB/YbcL family protein
MMIRTLLLALGLLPLMGNSQTPAATFTLRSNDLGGQATQEQVFNGFGCTGRNISPHLAWTTPPEGTRSFAVTLYDPDAPTGSGWWHWVVYDIPATATELPTGAGSSGGRGMPAGAVQGRTDYGSAGYGGPCPPEGHGPHRYILTVHALNTPKLEVPADASPALIGFMLRSASLGQASLLFHHQR